MSINARLSGVLRSLRFLVVGVAAFSLGSGSAMSAAAAGFPFGSLFWVSVVNGTPSKPCSTLGSGTTATTTCTAVVDSDGQLSSSDAATHAALGQLKFDGQALKVSSTGTATVAGHITVDNLPGSQTVNGHVTVDNLPATQNVNITGGSLSASTTSADSACFGFVEGLAFDNTSGKVFTCPTPFHVTAYDFYRVSGDDFSVQFTNTQGQTPYALGWTVHVHDQVALAMEHPLLADRVSMYCYSSCVVGYSIIGY